MRLSTKTRYGVRAIFDIGYHDHGRTSASQAKDIARRSDIPLRYLEQIFQDLRRAGLVESKRGPRGGYYLKRPAAEITLGDVVRALQGPIEGLFQVEQDCTDKDKVTVCSVTATFWNDLAQHMTRWFDSVSIADLIERGRSMGLESAGQSLPMYYI